MPVLVITETLVKVLTILIALLSIFSPIIYALVNNNWNISYLVTPVYELPRLKIDSEIMSPRITNETISLPIAIKNHGEIGIIVKNILANISSKDGEIRFPIKYHKEECIAPNSSTIIILNISKTIATKLFDYLWKKEVEIFSINVDLNAEILGAEVEVLFMKEFHFSLLDLGIERELAYGKILTAEYVNEEIFLKLSLINPSMWPIKVSRVNATVYTETARELGYLSLVNPEEIEAEEEKVIKLRLLLNEDAFQFIMKELMSSNKLDMIISGKITIEILDKEFEIPLEEHYTLTSEVFKS